MEHKYYRAGSSVKINVKTSETPAHNPVKITWVYVCNENSCGRPKPDFLKGSSWDCRPRMVVDEGLTPPNCPFCNGPMVADKSLIKGYKGWDLELPSSLNPYDIVKDAK